MATICLFEDSFVEQLEPFNGYYPSWDLLIGTLSLGQAVSRIYPNEQYFGVARHTVVSDDQKSKVKITSARELPMGAVLFVNSRIIDPWSLAAEVSCEGEEGVFLHNETVVAVRTTVNQPIESLDTFLEEAKATLPHQAITTTLASYVWEYIYGNKERIKADATHITLGVQQGIVHERATLVTPEQMAIGEGTVIAAGAVLDASKGPIILGKNVQVGANAVVLGPAFLGDEVVVNPLGYIRPDTSLGDRCKVGGELSASIMLADSNKQHFGYLGKSYVGSWCNLAAGSTTSNLKNTYGDITIELGSGKKETGLNSLGAFIGHHVKLGGLLSLSPGAVVGSFSNVMGAGKIPKYLPPLRWFDAAGDQVAFDAQKAADVATKVMARHRRQFTEKHQQALDSLI